MQEVERIVETVIVQEPVRQKLPTHALPRRRSRSGSPTATATSTVGEYDDGRPGEMFLQVAKQGSTLAGIMDAFAISVSHGLQYGVPLEAFVEMFTNMRFEPAGMTDDPDMRFATSLVDYIFRRLAVEYIAQGQARGDGHHDGGGAAAADVARASRKPTTPSARRWTSRPRTGRRPTRSRGPQRAAGRRRAAGRGAAGRWCCATSAAT